MKRLTLLSAIVPLMMLSCSTDDQEGAAAFPKDNNSVEFTLGGISSKVANNEFEIDDYISVQALDGTTEFKHAIYKYVTGDKFNSEDPIIYSGADIDAGKELSYKAIYPKVEGTFASTFDFTIPTNQNEDGVYSKSDLLVATLDATPSLTPELKFEHTLSNVIIDVVFTQGGSEVTKTISDFTIHALNVAECDIDADTYVGTGSAADITPAGSGSTYNAIIAPQELAVNGGLATLVVDSETVTMENADLQQFKSGKKYTVKWTIDIITKAQTVELTTTIGQWEDGVWGPEPVAVPVITTFDPTALTFTDAETASKDVTVTVTDLGDATLAAQSDGSHFTTSVSGTTITVTPTAANTGEADIVETITVSVNGGEDKTFTATHSKPEAGGGSDTSYPVTLDLSTLGFENQTPVVVADGTPTLTANGCSIEFIYDDPAKDHPNAPMFLIAGGVSGVKYTKQKTSFVISSDSPMTTIKFDHYTSNGARSLKPSMTPATGTIAEGATGDLGPIWTSADTNTKSVTFTISLGNMMIKAVEIN